MDTKTKFGAAYEKYNRRFTRSGFEVGNYVKIGELGDTSKYPAHYLDRISEIQSSDLPIQVSGIVRNKSLGEGNPEGLPEDFNIIIGQEFARGMMKNYVAVPANVLSLTEFEIPESWKDYSDESESEPKEAGYDKTKDSIDIPGRQIAEG